MTRTAVSKEREKTSQYHTEHLTLYTSIRRSTPTQHERVQGEQRNRSMKHIFKNNLKFFNKLSGFFTSIIPARN